MSQLQHRDTGRVRRLGLAAIVMMIAVLFGTASPVAAHTGFESSDPTDGAVVTDPVDVVTVTFTGDATPVGDEFVALNAAGEIQQPVEVTTTDNRVFVIRFDPPLAGGTVGIRWNVQAADAHPIEGAFAFTVDAPPPVAATTTSPSSAPADNPASDTPAGGDAATETASNSESDQVVTPASPATPATEAVDSTQAEPAGSTDVAGTSLEEFLTVDTSAPGESTATAGRVIGFVGVAIGVGMLAFAATTLRGRRGEVRTMLTATRAFGAVIAVGAAIEYVGVVRIAGDSLAEGWSTAPGVATVLRFVGGLGLALGLASTLSSARTSSARALSAMAIDEHSIHAETPRPTAPVSVRWIPDQQSWAALVGVAAIIASFWFDGHTVSKGFRPLHAAVNSVHVLAGAVWVGGVISIAAISWMRFRRGDPQRGVEMVLRFSKIASISLAGVLAAGSVMAVLVLDSFSELTGTEWGQILLLKSAAVGLALAGGAYNHFRLLPALEADPTSERQLAELRSSVTAEAIMLVFVVIVTAWLVAAASAPLR